MLIVVVTHGVSVSKTVWDVKDGKQFKIKSRIVCSEITSDGRLVAVGIDDGRVIVVDTTTAVVTTEFSAHTDLVNDLCFSMSGHRLVSANSLSVKCWDSSWRLIFEVNPSSPVQGIVVLSDGTIVVAEYSGDVTGYTDTGVPVFRRNAGAVIEKVLFSRNRNTIVVQTMTDNGRVAVFSDSLMTVVGRTFVDGECGAVSADGSAATVVFDGLVHFMTDNGALTRGYRLGDANELYFGSRLNELLLVQKTRIHYRNIHHTDEHHTVDMGYPVIGVYAL